MLAIPGQMCDKRNTIYQLRLESPVAAPAPPSGKTVVSKLPQKREREYPADCVEFMTLDVYDEIAEGADNERSWWSSRVAIGSGCAQVRRVKGCE